MSWLWRGFQSAVFYYVSCAPCTKLAYQRRRRKDNGRAKNQHADSETEQGLYQHPSPFNTNAYWKEEMAMGPGPPQKKQREQREKEREKERHRGDRGLVTGGVGSSAVTGTSSADTFVGSEEIHGREVEQERNSGEGWNRRRYQREDEMLWGINATHNSRRGSPKAGRSRAGTNSSAGSYQYGCNPAVNDLHPPIVSTRPTTKSEMQWMLQPPPPARVMEGKERANRSRSGSGGSYGSGRSNASSRRLDTNLGRQVGERLMEERMRQNGDSDSLPMVPIVSRDGIPSAPSHGPSGQADDGSRQPSYESLLSSNKLTTSQPKSAPPPSLSNVPDLRLPASRPPLSTINSSSSNENAAAAPVTKASKRPLRPTLLPMDSSSSLHVLQELVSPLNLNMSPVGASSKLNTMRRATSPLPEARIELPPTDNEEDLDLALPEFESRFPAKAGWQLSPAEERVMSLLPIS